MKHVMLDIETMGNTSRSAIIAIGAVKFDIDTGETAEEFYANVDLQSCIDLGLTLNASTIMWWMQREDEARRSFFDGQSLGIVTALTALAEFVSEDSIVWGNSSSFDCSLLADAYRAANIPTPWHYRNERCVRTLASFAPSIKEAHKSDGVAHNALSDCYYQIGYCCKIWAALKPQNEVE